jgi:hypothetical protein
MFSLKPPPPAPPPVKKLPGNPPPPKTKYSNELDPAGVPSFKT